jgi:hypothetical protein
MPAYVRHWINISQHPSFKYCLLQALFGDANTHQTSVLPQLESYVHRFGPGMVLYWFGHAPLSMLDDSNGDVTIVGWQLPEELLLPTGEIVS